MTSHDAPKEDDPFSLIERSIAARSPEAEAKPKAKRASKTKGHDDAVLDEPALASFFDSDKTKSVQHDKKKKKTRKESKPLLTDQSAVEPPTAPPSDLSELAKQLRFLQTKHDSQVLEIAGLERQLQILADLSNVNVGDLQAALQTACVQHAPSQIQADMATLRNELQLAQLQLQQQQSQCQVSSSSSSSYRNQVADLQLRVGELEELEQQQRQELSMLYKDLREQSSSWIRLKAQFEEQQLLLEEYREREAKWKVMMQQQQQSVSEGQDDNDEDQEDEENDDDMKQEEKRLELSEQMLRQEMELASDFGGLLSPRSEPEQSAVVNVEEQVELKQVAILQKQLEETEKAHKLKQAQLKARSFVLEERVQDLEQQMSSLYTAFNITSQDLDQEQQARRALESNLHAADEQVAQYIDKASTGEGDVATTAATPAAAAPTFTAFASPIVSPATPVASPMRAAASPGHTYSPIVTNSPPRRLSSPPPASPPRPSYSNAAAVSAPVLGELMLQGRLLLRTTGLARKVWKEKHASFFLANESFHLVLSNTIDERPSYKIYSAATGSAQLQVYSKQPYAFTLLVAPEGLPATVLYLAATNEIDFDNWMSVLSTISSHPDTGERVQESSASFSQRDDAWETSDDDQDAASREAADLERAIWLSTREQHEINGYC